MRRDDMRQARRVDATQEIGGGLVVQMTEAAGDALLQHERIIARGEQVAIVVALEDERIAPGEARLDVRGRHADVGEQSHAMRAVADHELHGLARVVRNWEWTHLEIADGEASMAVGPVYPLAAVEPAR